MATIHFIQQGKGGIGKSMVAVFLMQFLRSQGLSVSAFDTDPVNGTLFGFKEFDVRRLNILKGDNIDPRAFDDILEYVLGADEAGQPLLQENSHVLIDNGASSFVALSAYLRETEVVQTFQEAGHKVFLHSIIVGGQALTDTLGGLKVLAINFPTAPLVIWLNSYFGEIRMRVDGELKEFEDFKVYKEHSDQFHAIISIPESNAATLGKDLEDMLARRISFAAAQTSSSIMIAGKSRLKNYWNKLAEVMTQAELTI